MGRPQEHDEAGEVQAMAGGAGGSDGRQKDGRLRHEGVLQTPGGVAEEGQPAARGVHRLDGRSVLCLTHSKLSSSRNPSLRL